MGIQQFLSIYVTGTTLCGVSTKRRLRWGWEGVEVIAGHSWSWVSGSTPNCSFIVLSFFKMNFVWESNFQNRLLKQPAEAHEVSDVLSERIL
jgi:hypothetical protein